MELDQRTTKEYMIHWLESGESIEKIAKKMGLSRSGIQKYIPDEYKGLSAYQRRLVGAARIFGYCLGCDVIDLYTLERFMNPKSGLSEKKLEEQWQSLISKGILKSCDVLHGYGWLTWEINIDFFVKHEDKYFNAYNGTLLLLEQYRGKPLERFMNEVFNKYKHELANEFKEELFEMYEGQLFQLHENELLDRYTPEIVERHKDQLFELYKDQLFELYKDKLLELFISKLLNKEKDHPTTNDKTS